jgi:spermidine synthase
MTSPAAKGAVVGSTIRDEMRARAATITAAAFLAGAVLLGVEIAASRVLAPFFGNSLYVWGALIGVVLAGLSIGYWVGGALADRYPHPAVLVAAIMLGAAGVLAVPYLDGPVLEAVVDWDPGPRADPLLASILLFGAPSIVLATVTPIAVRLRARELARVGRTAGRLFSISTVGSIAGTFATAFWLVPELGTDQVLGVAAATLFAAAAIVAVVDRMVVGTVVAVGAAVAASFAAASLAPDTGGTLSVAAARNWSPVYRLHTDPSKAPELPYVGAKVFFKKDTLYHQLAVVQEGGRRTLRFGGSYQSEMFVNAPYRTAFEYTDYFFLGLAYDPTARSVLFVGLGGGSAPKRFLRDFPELRLHAVELDPVVVDVAHRFFAVPERLPVSVDDGRRWLDRHDGRWDVIAIDTFYDDGVPFHLTTREFLELVRDRLAPGGVVVTNIIGAVKGSSSKLFRSLYRTYRTVFPTVAVHPVGGSAEAYTNVMIVATEGAAPAKAFLRERWRSIRADHPGAPSLGNAIRFRWDALIPTRDVPTLTDAYAPVDALLEVH